MGDTSHLDARKHEAQMIALYKLEEIIEKIGAGGPTLRDQFAMAALTGIKASGKGAGQPIDGFAALAYDYADAMLSARGSDEEEES